MFLGIVVLVIYFFLYLVNKLICMDDDMLILYIWGFKKKIYIYICRFFFNVVFFFILNNKCYIFIKFDKYI